MTRIVLSILIALGATGCVVSNDPTVGDRVGLFCNRWVTWERTCFPYEVVNGTFADAYASCYDGMCGTHSGRDCDATPVYWTQERTEACVEAVDANTTCSVFGDTFAPPECRPLLGTKE